MTYRVWLQGLTPFGEALVGLSDRDGLTFETCLRTTRSGYAVQSHAFVDPIP